MAEVRLTRRALLDLEDIESYSIEQWGEAVASRYLRDVEAALSRLTEMPSLLRRKEENSTTLGFYPVREHLLVCDVIDGTIYVLTVWHGSMDLPDRISEMEPQLFDEARLLHEQILRARSQRDK